MADKRVTVTARVAVTVVVDVSDCWGGDCPVSQINKQARKSAVGLLQRSLQNTRVHITGAPTVTAVVVEDDAR